MLNYWKKKLYKEFYDNIIEQYSQKKAIFFIEEKINEIIIYILLGNKNIQIIKNKNQNVQLSVILYEENNHEISNELYLWIKRIKNDGFIIDNQFYVEKIYEIFNKIKAEYNINLKEQKSIWSFIFLHTNHFFENHLRIKTKNLMEQKKEQYND